MNRHVSRRLSPAEVTDLVREAQRGAPLALEELFGRLRPGFVRFFAATLPGDQAEDATQTALFRLSRALRRVTPETADRYIGTILRNVLRRERAGARARERCLDSFAGVAVPPITPDVEVELRELLHAAEQTIATMEPRDAAHAVDAVLLGYAPREIAAEQGVRQGTLRVRLARARAFLRSHLAAFR